MYFQVFLSVSKVKQVLASDLGMGKTELNPSLPRFPRLTVIYLGEGEDIS